MDESQNHSPQVAELCGAILGDGWIQKNEKSLFLAGNLSEDREYYDQHIRELIKENFIEILPREFPYWRVYGISIHKREIIKKFLELGMPTGKKVLSAEVPAWIMNGDKEIKKSFLRGFFDTDGCASCQKAYGKYDKEFHKTHHTKIRLSIGGITSNLIYKSQEICKELGIRTTVTIIKAKIKNNRNCREIYTLRIDELESIRKWFEEIIPANQKHFTKYLIWKKFGFCPPNTTLAERKDILKNKLNPYDWYL